MIGDAYLQQRADLDNALFSLQLTAGELRAPADRLVKLHQLQESLREPFLLVVLGESKVGKSTLLNALFGREFFRVDMQPPENRICLFKYGAEEKDIASSAHVTECHRQAAFLRNFNVLETPALENLGERHGEIIEKFVPVADGVWFVFDAANPGVGSTWQCLKLLGENDRKRAVLVVQKADLRSETEIAAAAEEMRKAAVVDIGHPCPVFAVSAKNALDAKLHGGARIGGGFIELEGHLADGMSASSKRKEKLEGVSHAAHGILKELRAQVDAANQGIQRDTRRIEQLQAALGEQKVQSIRQLEGFLWEVADAYEKAQKRGDEMLLAKLTPGATLKLIFKRIAPRYDFQRALEEKLREKVHKQIDNALDLLDADLAGVAKQLQDRIRGEFAAALPSGGASPNPTSHKAGLRRQIEPKLSDTGSHKQIEEQLNGMLVGTGMALRVMTVIAVACGIAAVVTALTHIAIGGVLAALAVLFAVVAFAIAGIKRKQIVADYNKYMAARREALLNGIEVPLRQAVDAVYAELDTRFAPLQAFCSARRKHYEPISAKLYELGSVIGKFQPAPSAEKAASKPASLK